MRSTACASPRQFPWVLALRPYSPGGTLNALASTPTPAPEGTRTGIQCPKFTAWTTRVSNPFCSPRFRLSASEKTQVAAYAFDVLGGINAFHRYATNSATPYLSQSSQYFQLFPDWVGGFNQKLKKTPTELFTPNKSGQRLHPTYYRCCWHVVCRCYFQKFTTRKPSSFVRRRCVRLSPIAQDSRLLPPVGVGPVSQCPCGWPTSQSSYPSKPW